MNAKKSPKKDMKKKAQGVDTSGMETLNIHGTEYITDYTKKFKNRKNWEAPDPNKILSYLPGTVMEVYVKEGQQLKEGDPIIILEAMKMRNKVVLTGEGTVKKVNVSVGDKIPKGHMIIEIEQEEQN